MKNIFKKIFIAALAVCLMAPVLTFSWGWGKPKKITIIGSTTVLPIAQKCAEVYMDKNKKADVSVSGGGSGVGIAALLDKRTDIADASRKIEEKEVKEANAKGIYPKEYVIAKDGILIILNKSVTGITNLTMDQLKGIFTGKIKNWKEVGGNDASIVVVSRDTSSGTYETVNMLVLKGEKPTQDALMTASNNAEATTVGTTPNSVGYIGIGYKDTAAVNIVSVENITASKETVLNGKYKIARNLQMYTDGPAKGDVKNFIDFVLSPEGQKIVEEEGFVALK